MSSYLSTSFKGGRQVEMTVRDRKIISRYRSLCDEMEVIHILHSMQTYDLYVPGRNVRLIGFLKSLFHHSVHGYSDACSSRHST